MNNVFDDGYSNIDYNDEDNYNSDNSELDNEDFTENLYKAPSESLNKINEEQEKNKKTILNKIAKIVLTYSLVNNLLKLKRKERIKLYWDLSSLTQRLIKNQSIKTESIIKDILHEGTRKASDFYKTELSNKDALDIVNKRFKGANFSERIYKNNDKISKVLHKNFNDFLKGKIEINDIKSNIEKTFNTSKYQAKRLVDTELSRIHNEIFRMNCKKNGIQKVIYKATFCNTCNTCAGYDGMVFDIEEAPYLPQHASCRCYFTYSPDDL